MSSFVFHVFFALFFLIFLCFLLNLKKERDFFKYSLYYFLKKNDTIYLPKDRGHVVRIIKYIENKIQDKFNIKAKFILNNLREVDLDKSIFLKPLFLAIKENFSEAEELFFYDGSGVSLDSLSRRFDLRKNGKKLLFIYSLEKKIWEISITNEKKY